MIKYKISRRDFFYGEKSRKRKNEIVEEFFRRNDPKNIKSMNDMYAAWKDFFAPAFQQLLDAEMEAKIGYSKMKEQIILILEMDIIQKEL